jgi:hypothetical protein
MPLPEHCTAPGVQATHAPPRQNGKPPVHATGVSQVPFAPHDCALPPVPPSSVHCIAPGVHTPPQLPAVQTNAHCMGLPHWPAVQVCTMLLEHWVAPVAQGLAQAPLVHTFGLAHAEPELCHVPVPSHVCGCAPLHCIEPGTQVPTQPPAVHA